MTASERQAASGGPAVLVTGASRGIGRATAQAFARRGARLAVHYGHNRSAAERTLAELEGSGHALVQADLTDPEAARAMVDRAAAALGGLDVLVNNAGIYEAHPILESDAAAWMKAWRRSLDVNLLAPAQAIHAAVRCMIPRGGGRIVNISSRGAFRGEPRTPAYAAAKAGLNAMSQSLAQALGPYGIYVYVVAPGWVETDMAAEALGGPEGDAIRAQSPLGRVATPEEVAHVVVFLASPGAEYLTGAIVDVNGASYLRT